MKKIPLYTQIKNELENTLRKNDSDLYKTWYRAGASAACRIISTIQVDSHIDKEVMKPEEVICICNKCGGSGRYYNHPSDGEGRTCSKCNGKGRF